MSGLFRVAIFRKIVSQFSTHLVEILVILLFAYISLVPFYYLQPLQLTSTLPSFFPPKYLPFLIAFTLTLVWLDGVWRTKRQIIRTAIDPFVATYLGISLLSLINAPYPLIGLVKWGYYNTTGVLLCCLIVQYYTTWSAVRRLALGLCIIGGVVVVYTLITCLLGRDYLWGDFQQQFNPKFTPSRVTGPFGNPTSTATYLMLLFPFPCWFSSATTSLAKKTICLILSALCLLIIVLTQTRGALLAAGVALVILAPLLGRLVSRLPKTRRRLFLSLFSLVTIVIAVAVIHRTPSVGEQLLAAKARWEALFSPAALANTERFRISQYRTTLNVLKEHPLLGTGFGNFSRVFATYRDTSNYMVWEFPEHTTDNMYLMVTAETGWLGLAAALALCGAVFSTVYRAYRKAPGESPGMLLLAFLAGGIGFLVNMGTWDALNDPTIRMTFWLLAGVALSVVQILHSADRDGSSR